MKRREILPYGYKAFTGKILSDYQVDGYNRIQERINSFMEASLPVPEEILNESHKYFLMAIDT